MGKLKVWYEETYGEDIDVTLDNLTGKKVSKDEYDS